MDDPDGRVFRNLIVVHAAKKVVKYTAALAILAGILKAIGAL